MRAKTFIKITSFLVILTCATMIIPIITALYYNEHAAMMGFIKSAVMLTIPSVIILSQTWKTSYKTLSMGDGFLMVSIIWIAISLASAVPFYLSGVMSFADSVFEATAGITATGGTIIPDLDAVPRAIIMWRSVTNWVGGMGIIILTVAILPLLGFSGLSLFKVESTNVDYSKITPRIAQTAKFLWGTYVGISVISFILLAVGGMGIFDSLNHAMSSVATGGFSTKNNSIAYYSSPYIQWVIAFSMLMGGLNFYAIFSLIKGEVKQVILNTEVKAYFILIGVTTVIMTLVNLNNSYYTELSTAIRQAFFHSVSGITSTGFAADTYTNWPMLSQMLIIILMFIGGCSNSTAGGFKVMRVVVLLKQAAVQMKHLVSPHEVTSVRINGYSIKPDVVSKVFVFFFLYFFSIVIVAVVCASAGVDLMSSISVGISTIGNVGAGFGTIGPEFNYAHFPEYVKLFISFALIAARLEIYAIAVLFLPSFWRSGAYFTKR